MAKAPGVMPKLEILIIGLLFLGFMLWAMSKCNSTRQQYRAEAEAAAVDEALEDSIEATFGVEPLDTSLRPLQKKLPAVSPSGEALPPLYVTVKNLNMRTGPSLGNKIVDRLGLFEVVYFLGEVTDSLHTINLGEITTTEPWVKVRTKRGIDGWVYGACVDYYKHELEGVSTD